jgi:hypothetical protein
MGRMKEYMLELQARGYGEIPDKYVCVNCFDDYALKNFIKLSATHKICSYCNKKYKTNKCVKLEDIITYILECIMTEWEDPAESFPYESKEGGYQGNTYDTYDLLLDQEPIMTIHQELFNDIHSSYNNGLWGRNFFLPYEEMIISEEWYRLTESIKHRQRFTTFINLSYNEDDEDDYDINYNLTNSQTGNMSIKYISNAIKHNNLLSIISKNTYIYRLRKSNINTNYNNPHEMGSIPKINAKHANRMSPVGIPMFYGALDINTALLEIRPCDTDYIHIAKFRPSRALFVVNFSSIPYIPSIYENNKFSREEIRFLHDFVKHISMPISSDANELEYIPTQVITEYLRYFFKYEGKNIDGIIYKSSFNLKKAIVLFVENEQCTAVDKNNDEQLSLYMCEYRKKFPSKTGGMSVWHS